MTIMNAVRAALDDRIINMPSVPLLAYQNVPYEHAPGVPFIKISFLPTSRRLATMGNNPQQLYQGIYKLLICYPEAAGPGAVLDMVDTVLNRFPAAQDLTFNGQTITIDYSEAGTGFLDSPFYCVPVNIAWYVYHA